MDEKAAKQPRSFQVLHRNEWLEVRRTPDDYVYVHERRCGGHLVAVLLLRDDLQAWAARHEDNPAHGGPVTCALTGGVGPNERLADAARREVWEEAGVRLSGTHQLTYLGACRPYKAADTVVHLFAAVIPADALQQDPPGDGSPGEQGAWCEWEPIETIASCGDPLVALMWLRAQGTPLVSYGR